MRKKEKLTRRDSQVLSHLAVFQVLTTEQSAILQGVGLQAARKRLARLRSAGMVEAQSVGPGRARGRRGDVGWAGRSPRAFLLAARSHGAYSGILPSLHGPVRPAQPTTPRRCVEPRSTQSARFVLVMTHRMESTPLGTASASERVMFLGTNCDRRA